MDRLGDNELFHIFKKIPYFDLKDKRSFAQVSKRFMKVACVGLHRFQSYFPDLLFDILPSSPNLRIFSCYNPLSNTHLNLLAQSCPNLRELKLGLNHDPDSSESEFDFDFDNGSLCVVANSCIHLRDVYLGRRLHVGDAGIVSVVTSCKNLITLNLIGCIGVTDESLKAIGESSIRNLNLGGCKSITDLGLEYLATGDLKNCLLNLGLSGCDKIGNNGVSQLGQMACLTELNLSQCGVLVSYSVSLLSQLPNIEMLDLSLSWMINITDESLVVIGNKCLKLQEICLSGCEAITVVGLHGFSSHPTLKSLILFTCYNFSWEDVESVSLTCAKLKYLGVMKKIKTPLPEFEYDYLQIGRRFCRIVWEDDGNKFLIKSRQ